MLGGTEEKSISLMRKQKEIQKGNKWQDLLRTALGANKSGPMSRPCQKNICKFLNIGWTMLVFKCQCTDLRHWCVKLKLKMLAGNHENLYGKGIKMYHTF